MEVAPWKLRWIRVCGFMLTMFPSILTVSTTHGVPYSLQSQSISDDAPWLCRSATSMPLFWPCFLISSGAGSVVMNAITSYMFVIRLSQFVRLRLEGDDTFIAFYGVNCNPNPKAMESSRYCLGTAQMEPVQESEVSQTLSLRDIPSASSMGHDHTHPHAMSLEVPRSLNVNGHGVGGGQSLTHSPSASVSLSEDQTHPQHHGNVKRKRSRSLSVETVVDKLRAYNEQKRRAKARRKEREQRIYKLIKKQSILSGIVAASDAMTWIPSMFVSESDALTLILANSVIGVICVYLTFTFSARCFDCCCQWVVDNCTIIEDHIERQLAHKMQIQSTLHETAKGGCRNGKGKDLRVPSSTAYVD